MDIGLDLQEIPQQIMPMLGKDRLRMELHAFHRQAAMAQAHDLVAAAIGVFGPCGDFEALRQRFLLDHERVIATATVNTTRKGAARVHTLVEAS